MAKQKKIYSGQFDAAEARAFFDRIHRLRDELEQFQQSIGADISEVINEMADATGCDPAVIRMEFQAERARRKLEKKLETMTAFRKQQLDDLHAALGAFADTELGTATVEAVAPKKPLPPHNPATGEIYEYQTPSNSTATTRGLSPTKTFPVAADAELPAFLRRQKNTEPIPA